MGECPLGLTVEIHKFLDASHTTASTTSTTGTIIIIHHKSAINNDQPTIHSRGGRYRRWILDSQRSSCTPPVCQLWHPIFRAVVCGMQGRVVDLPQRSRPPGSHKNARHIRALIYGSSISVKSLLRTLYSALHTVILPRHWP